MDAGQTTQNHVSYIFSKEVILKGLLEQGTISESDFERYDQMLYDRDINEGDRVWFDERQELVK